MTLSLETGAHWRPEGPGAYLGWSAALKERPRQPKDEVAADWMFPALALDAVARFSPFWDEIARRLAHANVTVEAGLYDLTPDAKPLIGASGQLEGLYFNTGYSGHGVMGSPAGGRHLVDLMLGRSDGASNPYDPERFKTGAWRRTKPPL